MIRKVRKIKMDNEISAKWRNDVVAQHNELIQAVAKMDKVPLKLFEIIVGTYDSRSGKSSVKVPKEKIYQFIGGNVKNRSRNLKEALESLLHNSVFSFSRVNENNKVEHLVISPLNAARWIDDEPDIIVKFDQELLPYISMLRDNFTQYRLSDVAKLNSKHAITLYKLLAMSFNQYEYYQKHSGNLRNHKQLEDYQNPIFSVAELKRITQTEDKYVGHFGNFAKKVLDEPLKEINDNTDFTVTYDRIKTGRKITQVQFHIAKNNVTKVDNDQPQIKEVNVDNYQQVLEDPITALLVVNKLVTMAQMFKNKKLGTELYKNVYPLYHQIENKYGENELNSHLKYLTSQGTDIEEEQLSNYLLVAAKNRLNRLAKKGTINGGKKALKKQSNRKRIKEVVPAWAQEGYNLESKKATPEELAESKRLLAELHRNRAKRNKNDK